MISLVDTGQADETAQQAPPSKTTSSSQLHATIKSSRQKQSKPDARATKSRNPAAQESTRRQEVNQNKLSESGHTSKEVHEPTSSFSTEPSLPEEANEYIRAMIERMAPEERAGAIRGICSLNEFDLQRENNIVRR